MSLPAAAPGELPDEGVPRTDPRTMAGRQRRGAPPTADQTRVSESGPVIPTLRSRPRVPIFELK